MPIETIDLQKSSKEPFKPTAEEVHRITEKMKDPEFARLMGEYAEAMQSEEYRKEQEDYLNQVEEEARKGGDYSFDFIFPKPAYFVELLSHGTDPRVFVNMCTCDKVEEYREQPTGDKMASNWQVPVSIGRPRNEKFESEDCLCFDAVFHPKTLSLSDRSDRFMTFLVEIAVDNINNGYKKSYGYEYRRRSSRNSEMKSLGTPANQTVRRADTAGQLVMDKGSTSNSTENNQKQINNEKNTKPREKKEASKGGRNNAALKKEEVRSKTPEQKKADTLPKHTISHRGTLDLTDAWNWRYHNTRVGVPKELVVSLHFPETSKASTLDVEIAREGTYIEIHKTPQQQNFGGVIVLPFSVKEVPVSARFDTQKRLLTLVLAVKAEHLVADVPEELKEMPLRNEEKVKYAKDTVGIGAANTSEKETPPILIDTKECAVEFKVDDKNKCESSPEDEEKGKEKAQEATPDLAPDALIHNEECPVQAPDVAERLREVQAKVAEARVARETLENEHKAVAKKAVPSENEAKADIVTNSAQEGAAEQKEDTKNGQQEVEVVDLRTASTDKSPEKEGVVVLGDEEDAFVPEEVLQKKRETQKLLREQRRKEEEEREAERLEQLMTQKMAELPLKSRFIFEIA